MTDPRRLEVKRGFSRSEDEVQAVRELRDMIGQDNLSAVIFFCTTKYDLDKLGQELSNSFDAPLIGCTTAGEISPAGYAEGAITAAAISSDSLKVHPYVISPLKDVHKKAEEIGRAARERFPAAHDSGSDSKTFGFLLVDGLSVMEEQVIAHLSNALDSIPLVGGSAGDDMRFKNTYVYANGQFISDAAVLALFETSLPFTTFRTQHFVKTDKKMVITRADAERRVVYDINGEPAAWEYARLLGLEVEELAPMIFSKYPVMLRIGGEYYVRSIQKVNDDGSLTFFCAIDEGLVLTIAQGVDMVENLEAALTGVRQEIPDPQLILGCDCILRRLEMQEKGLLERVGQIMCNNNVIGFSTYGEQFNSVHVNQTFTGVAIGG